MRHKLYAGGLIVGLMFALVGCMLFDREDPKSPTAPLLPTTANQMVNCFDGQGISTGFGVYIGTGYFVANVPQAGDYVVQYKTRHGVFDVVFRAKGPRMIYIGVQDDNVTDAVVVPTTIIAPDSGGQAIGKVIVFSMPGLGYVKKLHELTIIPAGANLFAPATLPDSIRPIFIIKNGNPAVFVLTYESVYHAIPEAASSPVTLP